MSIPNPLWRFGTIIVTVLVGVALASCGGSSKNAAATDPATNCLTTSAAQAAPATSVIALAADPGQPGDRATQTDAIQKVLDAGFSEHAQLLLGGLSTVTPLTNVRLEGEGANQLFRDSDRSCKEHGIMTAFTNMITGPVPEPADIFGGLRQVASHLTGISAASIDVVLLSNMINGTPPLDMTNPSVVAQGTDAMLRTAANTSLVPSCIHWRVYIVEAGSGSGTSLAEDTTLRDFWAQFFKQCGGQLVVYDTSLVTFPVTSAKPVVARVSLGTTTVVVPSDVLFAIGSAELSPEATTVIGQVESEIDQDHATAVVVNGHTDSTGDPAANQRLSEARATSVAAALVGDGANANIIATHGYGDTKPVASNDTAQGRAQNRRVEIVLTTA